MSKVSHDALLELLGRVSIQGAEALALLNKRVSGCVQQLTSAVKLLVLILKGNRLLPSDLNCLPNFQHLRWLDVSNNQLKELPKAEIWAEMTELRVLYLHENLLSDWEAIKPLESLSSVFHITLFNNPIVHQLGYRHYLVSELQSLLVLDFYVITDEERLSDVSYSSYFKTLTDITKFPLQEAETTEEQELLGLYTRTVYKMKRRYERCSAVIRIQATWRGHRFRKGLGGFVGKRDQAAMTIQRCVRGFLLRSKLKHDLESLLKTSNKQFLLYEPKEYVKYLAVQKIERFMIRHVLKGKREQRNREAMAVTLQKHIRRWLALREDLPIRSKKFYVFKHQTGTLLSILRAVTRFDPKSYHPMKLIGEVNFPEFFKELKMKPEKIDFETAVELIKPCTTVKVIRFPDLDAIPYNHSKAVHFTSWMKSARIVFEGAAALTQSTRICTKFSGFRATQRQLLTLKCREGSLNFTQRTKYLQLVTESKFDDYHDLVSFRAPTMKLVHRVLAVAHLYNAMAAKQDFPLFIPLLEESVQKVAAVCYLQSYWVGRIHQPIPNLALLAVEKRAILCIQRWWRGLRMMKRILHLSILHKHLLSITTPVLYVEEHICSALNKINEQNRSGIKFQECGLQYKSGGGDIAYSRQGGRGIPDWMNLQFPSFRAETGFIEESLETLVLYNAEAERTQLHKVTTNKAALSDAGLSLIQLNYPSVEAARRRTAMVYFRTLDVKQGLGILLLTKPLLEDEFLMPKLKKLWKRFKIDLKKQSKIAEKTMRVEMTKSTTDVAMKPDGSFDLPPMPKKNVNLSAVMKEIEEHQSRGDTEVSARELAQWRVKRAKEDTLRKQEELKATKDAEQSTRTERQLQDDRDRLNLSLEAKANEITKAQDLRFRLRSKEAETSMRKRSEREFVQNFALNCNMLANQIVKGQINRLRRKREHENSVFVKSFKEKCAREREIHVAINYERFKLKQANKSKATPFVL